MSLIYCLYEILVSAVQFMEIESSVFLTKQTGFSELWTPDYYQFQQVYVFNLNQVGISSINNWLAKSNWRLVTWFDWLNSDVTIVTSVTSAKRIDRLNLNYL